MVSLTLDLVQNRVSHYIGNLFSLVFFRLRQSVRQVALELFIGLCGNRRRLEPADWLLDVLEAITNFNWYLQAVIERSTLPELSPDAWPWVPHELKLLDHFIRLLLACVDDGTCLACASF